MRSTRVFVVLLLVLGSTALFLGESSAAVVSAVPCTPSPMAIQYGQLIACEINPIGDVDTFTFAGTAGDQIVITLQSITLDSAPCAALTGPNGNIIPEDCTAASSDSHFAMFRAVLPVTGTYALAINEHANNELNRYLVALVRESTSPPAPNPPPGVVSPVACTSSPMAIQYGQLIPCEINPIGDIDTFTFAGTAGDQIVIALHGISLDSGPCATLTSPGGAVIVPEQCNVFPDTSFVMIRAVLPVTGTYALAINERANNELNRYLFALLHESASPPGVVPAVACTPSPMAIQYGQLIACEINPIGDIDTFTFAGTAGDQIVITLHGISLDSGPCATLISPSSAVIVPEQCNVFPDTNFVMIRALLPVTGTYALAINEHANNELNRYLFSVVRESVSPPGPNPPPGVLPSVACTPSPMAVQYGQLIACEIDPIGEIDTFTFAGTAGDQIVIILHGISLDSGPCATLTGPSGAVIVPEQCNVFPDTNFVMIRALLPVTGTYALAINEHANNELNRYLFALLRERSGATDSTPPALTLPTTITVDATSFAGAVVTYTASALDGVDGVVPVTCTPSSGSTFPIGTTTVACTAADRAGNVANGSFQVNVRSAVAQIVNLISLVQSMNLGHGITNSLRAKLQNALSAAQRGDAAAACGQLAAFINEAQAQSGKQLSVAQANQLIASANQIKAVIGCP